ncbi:putative DNA modification/repair radical SAM protein [candidate division WOR-1 bacterium RIFOXYB2_FULL_42_35]|uniref:Putative DNA modification/repair radical SAM protein n=1 Tax=candidate division WOR-1 bacterium RIFOXYC2_FULL_41_25 TaxID=1802586 RepID=A0A1F4TRV6_UNCSA|nr:MAG: putative DNA modification/repair radical SAM protein [candidate division WOR-1 bacterium RIFOXYA2_FULL_41_14]OGC27405.1 MAG: putative DNA modification/repair radical SAM protein [candidate division WOR-1 bacterium RIFOXYB2_FULL_42_35]OGC35445.1 MAG: putative DNA modification/repair radical SAM protein [candidate division WOR-1 bacterium RIFOXYC2_FULL_41_25]
MTPEEKLQILGDSAKYDVSCCGGSQRQVGNIPGLYYASGSRGKVIPILKTLFTNECKNNCMYCVNRVSRDIPRATFTPDELAKTFAEFSRQQFVEGLFLSSGVAGQANQTMQKMIDTAALLRYKHRYRGYIHLKILPGSHHSMIRRALKFATRVSVNIETPTPQQLCQITTGKDFHRDIIDTMEIIKEETEQKTGWVDQSTQFIVGATKETDQQIVKTMAWLREKKGLNRTYFSAYTPVDKAQSHQDLVQSFQRKNRLYQTEFLLRLYGFNSKEIYFNQEGKLPNNIDPKLNYALHNQEKFPIEINTASRHQLLRIPGIGQIAAERIIQARHEGRLSHLTSLKQLGAATKRAAPFILINGKKQGSLKDLNLSEQLSLNL